MTYQMLLIQRVPSPHAVCPLEVDNGPLALTVLFTSAVFESLKPVRPLASVKPSCSPWAFSPMPMTMIHSVSLFAPPPQDT
jgi:hypothetical protein